MATSLVPVLVQKEKEDISDLRVGHGLSLVPYRAISLSFVRQDGLPKLVNQWELREAIEAKYRSHASAPNWPSFNEKDLTISWTKNLDKITRGEPIAVATLLLWGRSGESVASSVVSNFGSWETRVSAARITCHAEPADSPSYGELMRDWLAEESGRKGGSEKRPDTLRVCGIPCRWLAEERVSTKPSLLIAHTVFSSFGPVRNIELLDPNEELPSAKVTQGRTLGVAGAAASRTAGLGLGLGAGLALKLETDVMVRFGSHSTFCDAVKALARHAVKKTRETCYSFSLLPSPPSLPSPSTPPLPIKPPPLPIKPPPPHQTPPLPIKPLPPHQTPPSPSNPSLPIKPPPSPSNPPPPHQTPPLPINPPLSFSHSRSTVGITLTIKTCGSASCPRSPPPLSLFTPLPLHPSLPPPLSPSTPPPLHPSPLPLLPSPLHPSLPSPEFSLERFLEGSLSLARVQLVIDGGDYFDERNVRRRRFTREQRAEEERQQREREERRKAERERAERERKEVEERKAREEEERVRREEEEQRRREEEEEAERLRQLEEEEERRRLEELQTCKVVANV
ncbi:unnamed protein product [Closterium sp. NIES-65]|nr:unnamed protein product [Closterium sp. NIES-65]